MNFELIRDSLVEFRERLSNKIPSELLPVARAAEQENPWFTERSFFSAYRGIVSLLSEDSFRLYEQKYERLEMSSKTLGLVLAGNIPAVGFHDILIGLLAGCSLKIKLSSQDKTLIMFLLQELFVVNPDLKSRVSLVQKLVIDQVDAVIATGSNNTSRYFEQYFSKKPNIIRKSRTSVAIIDGSESEGQLEKLTDDIFQYYGLGCRNVSKILLTNGASIIPLMDELCLKTEVSQLTKYDNNYLYYKSIFLVNKEEFLDGETILVKKSEDLHSPISVLHYQEFDSSERLNEYLNKEKDNIQCVVGNDYLPFGEAQNPGILDYPDGVDVRKFIHQLG